MARGSKRPPGGAGVARSERSWVRYRGSDERHTWLDPGCCDATRHVTVPGRRALHTGPVVAVTATIREEDEPRRVRLNAAYLTALENAGLVPLIVSPLADPAAADRILAGVDGLLLTGGGDVAPEYFGEEPHPKL